MQSLLSYLDITPGSKTPRGVFKNPILWREIYLRDSPSDFQRAFILHKNIHAMRVGTLFTGELDTISKKAPLL